MGKWNENEKMLAQLKVRIQTQFIVFSESGTKYLDGEYNITNDEDVTWFSLLHDSNISDNVKTNLGDFVEFEF